MVFQPVQERASAAPDDQEHRRRNGVEQEGLAGRTRGGAGLAQEFGQPDDGEERGFLEGRLPDISERGQGEAQRLGSDDPAQQQEFRHAARGARLDLAPVEAKIGGAVGLRLVGAGDDAHREDADDEGRQGIEAGKTASVHGRRQDHASAEVEQVHHQDFRNAAENRGVSLADQT